MGACGIDLAAWWDLLLFSCGVYAEVISRPMVLPTAYRIAGTDAAYGATRTVETLDGTHLETAKGREEYVAYSGTRYYWEYTRTAPGTDAAYGPTTLAVLNAAYCGTRCYQ
eukprot:39544-Rhodomonas_salina.1